MMVKIVILMLTLSTFVFGDGVRVTSDCLDTTLFLSSKGKEYNVTIVKKNGIKNNTVFRSDQKLNNVYINKSGTHAFFTGEYNYADKSHKIIIFDVVKKEFHEVDCTNIFLKNALNITLVSSTSHKGIKVEWHENKWQSLSEKATELLLNTSPLSQVCPNFYYVSGSDLATIKTKAGDSVSVPLKKLN